MTLFVVGRLSRRQTLSPLLLRPLRLPHRCLRRPPTLLHDHALVKRISRILPPPHDTRRRPPCLARRSLPHRHLLNNSSTPNTCRHISSSRRPTSSSDLRS